MGIRHSSSVNGGHAFKYEPGDYVKVEFEGETGLPAEWLWVRVESSDHRRKIVFGILDNQPLSSKAGLSVGQSLAVSYGKIRNTRSPGNSRRIDRSTRILSPPSPGAKNFANAIYRSYG